MAFAAPSPTAHFHLQGSSPRVSNIFRDEITRRAHKTADQKNFDAETPAMEGGGVKWYVYEYTERGALYQRKTKKPPTLESTPARRAVRAVKCSLARDNALSRDIPVFLREFVDFRATLPYTRANSNVVARQKISF